MSRANDYLRSALSFDQYEEYRRQAALDSRDSEARKRYRWLHSTGSVAAHRRDTHRAWLMRYGYIDQEGRWISAVKR